MDTKGLEIFFHCSFFIAEMRAIAFLGGSLKQSAMHQRIWGGGGWGVWGEGAGVFSFRDGFDPLPTQWVTLCTIWEIHFSLADLKTFLKYTNFEWGARAEKTRFFAQHFPKSA